LYRIRVPPFFPDAEPFFPAAEVFLIVGLVIVTAGFFVFFAALFFDVVTAFTIRNSHLSLPLTPDSNPVEELDINENGENRLL